MANLRKIRKEYVLRESDKRGAFARTFWAHFLPVLAIFTLRALLG